MRRLSTYVGQKTCARSWLGQIVALILALAALALVQVPLAADTIAEAITPPPPSELVQFRTLSSRTFDNHDGTYTTSAYSGRIHYRDDAGVLRPISSQLVASQEPGYAYENEANSFRAFFKSQLDSNYLQLALGPDAFLLSLQDAAQSQAQTRARGISYPDVLPGADLRYELQPDGLKETLFLQNAQAPLSYRFLLNPPPGARIHAVQRDDGSWAFYLARHARPVFVLDAPWASEADEPDARRRHAALAVSRQGADFVLDLTLDGNWLHDPARQFPVRVDPTITIQPPFQDASFDFACPGCAGVTSDRLSIGTVAGADSNPIWRSALQFSLADIPDGASISSAKLKLYFDGTCLPAGTPCGGTSHQIDALRMANSWSPSAKSSSLAFDTTPLTSFTLPNGASAQWMNWDITSTVQNWYSGAQSNFGLLLKRSTEPLASSGPKPPSRNYAAEPTLGPKLEVTYNGDGGQLLEPETVHSNGAELHWIPYSGPGAPPFDSYEVHRSTNPNFTPSESTQLTKIVGDPAVTSFRDTTAKPGATFTYKVVVNGYQTNRQTVTMPADGLAQKLLHPDSKSGLDTYISERSDSTDCVNRGAVDSLKVGTDAISIWRSLLRFDLSDIAPDATLSNATLSLWHPTTTSTALTVRAHQLTGAWEEGSGIAACTGDGATWYESDGGIRWGQNGGDYDGTAAASLSIPSGAQPSWSQLTLTSLAQQWVDGTEPNDGVLLKLDDEARVAGKSVDFYSSDFAVAPTLRPKLSVTYADGSHAIAPTVTVSKPVAGALVKGNTVQIEAAALDDRRVDLVEFFADGSLIGSDSSAPFSATWNSTTEGNGSHGLTARATDDAGNQTTSAAVSVTVGNSAPPTTAITSPAGGSIVTGTVTVNASAADDVAVTKVEFYADGLLFATDTAAPYSATWNTLDPALPAYDGAHTLTTKAYDGHAQVTTSTAVSVTAANASGTRFLADYSSTPIPSTFTFQPGIQTQATTPIDVTVKNRSAVTWSDSTIFLRYRWFRLGSSTSIVDSANTSLGAPVLPNGQVTRQLLIAPPDVPPGVGRANYRLRIDLYDQGTGSWFAGQGTKPLEQTLTIEQLNPAHPPTPPLEPLSAPEQFGVEPMFQYDHEQLGLGMENLVNVASGNSVVRWRPLQAPGKGLASVVQLTYNSLEGRCNANFCPIGSGWSLSVSSLTRFGQQALKVTGNRAELVDADGTLHLFDWDNQASKWIPRPGTHLYLRDDGAHPAGYLVTTPNRVTYAYDCGGNPTSVTDKNGNELTFVLDSPPNGCSSQRVVDVKDAANRAFHIDYYEGTPENKRVRSITDHDGRRLEFCYDPQGGDHPNLLQVIEHTAADTSNCDAPAAASRSFTFTYEPDGSQQNRQLQTVTDPAGHATAFDYWPSGDPREDKLSARTDRENAQTAFDYAMQADPGSNTTTVTAPPTDASRVTVYTDAHDAASTDGNQDQGLIDSILDPEQRTTTIAWTNTGQSGQPLRHVWKVTEPQSRTTELTYNTRGLVTDRYDPMGHHWHFDYLDVPADGGFTTDLTSVKDPNAFSQSGNPWTFVYDASNINLLKVIDPDGSQAEPFMTYSYYTGAPGYPGAIHSALDGNGNGPTVEAYDHNGLPTQVRDAEQGVSQASYDPSGLLQWSQDPLHYGDDPSGYGRDIRTVFDYDGFGRPIAMSEPKSTRYQRGELIWRSLVYDANDNVLVSRHPAYGRPASPGAAVTTMSYDHMDRLLTSTSAESHETAFTYDGAGRLTSVRRPKGFVNPPPPALSYVTAFHYDRLDRVLSRVQYGADGVDNRRTYFCYSNAGDLRWVTAPKAGLTDAPSPCETDTGVPRYTTRYAYNAAHRVTSITEPLHTQSPANETRTRTFDYDANGNTTSVTAEIDDQTNSVTNYTYTRRNEPELTSQLYTSGPRYVTSKLVYDRAGNVIRSVSPRAWDAAGGQDPGAGGDYVTEYRYDALNRLERIALPKKTGGDPRTYIHRRYDPNGNLRWTTLPVEVAEVSDPPQELTADQWSEYKYFDPGWISTSNDHVKPEVHYDYTAEGFQQQRNLCGNEGCDERTWSYNRDGLLSFLTEHSWRGSGTASYSYDENDNLTTAVEARGITKPSETAYTIESLYNGYDEPTQTRQKQETDSDYRYTNFHYDPNGNPAQRWDDGNSPEAGRSHEFAYDESDQLTSDYDYGPDKARNTADDQQTAYDYWLTGWDREKAITRPLATGSPTEAKTDWTYFLNGDLKTLQTRNRNDTLVEHHTLDYVDGAVYMNGNQVSDTFGLQTAAASACDTPTAARSTATAPATSSSRNRTTGPTQPSHAP